MYPGLPSHPQHQVAKKQMKMFSGMIAAEIKGGIQGGKILVEVWYQLRGGGGCSCRGTVDREAYKGERF
jgi:hypothetical protein